MKASCAAFRRGAVDIIVEIDPCWRGIVYVEASRVNLGDDITIDARISDGDLVGMIN